MTLHLPALVISVLRALALPPGLDRPTEQQEPARPEQTPPRRWMNG